MHLSFLIGYQPPTQQHTAFFMTEKQNIPQGDRPACKMLCVVVWRAGTRLKTTNALNTTLDLVVTRVSVQPDVRTCI